MEIAWASVLVGATEGDEWRRWIIEGYQEARDVKLPDLEFFRTAACAKYLLGVGMILSGHTEALGVQDEAREQVESRLYLLPDIYGHLTDTTGIRMPSVEALLE